MSSVSITAVAAEDRKMQAGFADGMIFGVTGQYELLLLPLPLLLVLWRLSSWGNFMAAYLNNCSNRYIEIERQ